MLAPALAAGLLGVSSLPGALVSASDWQSDLKILKRSLLELHPGLFRYQTRAEFESRFASLSASLSKPAPRGEGFLLIAEFLQPIQCGHTYTNFFNQPKEVTEELFAPRNKIPFTFRWLNGEMVILKSVTPQCSLPPGTVIKSLNGVPTTKVLSRLMKVARADGGNDDKRRKYLEVNGLDGLEAFDIYLPLAFPFTNPSFDLVLRKPGSPKDEKTTVGALDLQERVKAVPAKSNDENAPGWTERMASPSALLVEMPGWAFYNSKWDWQGALQKLFEKLDKEKIPNLIIDIRQNEGGVDVGDEIVSHLIDSPLSIGAWEKTLAYRKTPPDLDPYLSTWDNSFRDWGKAAGEKTARGYRLRRPFEADLDVVQPKLPRYRGKVLVLMGATNSSATFQFLSLLRRAKTGTLIGQPSGGNQRGINGGAFFFLTLPGSKIEVDIPLIGFFAPGTPPDAGIRPDVAVKPSLQAIAKGEDQELAAALSLAARP